MDSELHYGSIGAVVTHATQETPTGQLRWRAPKGPTTQKALLQQEIRTVHFEGTGPRTTLEWRDVPVVVEGE